MKQVQVLDSDWFKTDHRAVLAVLSLRPKMRYTMRNGANLRGWEPDDSWHKAAAETLTDWKSWNKMVPLLMETAVAHRKLETKEMSVTELELKNTSVEKEENRTIPRAIRFELALSRNLEKEKSVETRETFGQDQGECGDGKAPKKTQASISDLQKTKIPESVLTKFFQDLYSIPEDQEESTQSERRHWVELWKNMRMDCAGGNVDLAIETGKCLEEAEKRERVTGSDHSRCFESIASRMFGEAGKVVVVDVLGYEFPGRLAVLVDGDGSESGGCNVLDQVQTDSWTVCDAESVGLCMAQVTPSTEIRVCAKRHLCRRRMRTLDCFC